MLSAAGIGGVEMFYDREWRTVCDHFWSINDAKVVCRQLGYHQAVRALPRSLVPIATWRGSLEYVACTGNEDSLSNCSHGRWGTNYCSNNEVAGVECSSGKIN